MRFIDDKVEFSQDETIGIFLLSLLGTILAFFTYGLTFACIILGIYYYYTSEKEKDSRIRKKIQDIAKNFESTRNRILELNLYESYLTSRDMKIIQVILHATLTKLEKFKPIFDHIVDEIVGILFSYSIQLQEYNENYIAVQEVLHRDFFSGEAYHGGMPFNEKQVRAILTNDINNLIIAGPGAGKTRVLTSRAAFFVHRKGIPASDILILAYNKRAVNEIKIRLKHIFGIENVKVSTFHSLGLQTLRTLTKSKPKVEGQGTQIIKEIVDKLVNTDDKFQTEYLSYVSTWSRPDDLVELEPELMDERFRSRLYETYRALDGTNVKSIAERDIANYLLQHDIPFEYEREVTWCDKDIEDPELIYHPDFYFPENDIYLEHWAVNSDSRPPSFFSPEESRRYLGNMCWKWDQYRKHGKTLWETNNSLFIENRLIPVIEGKFKEIGLHPQKLSYSALLRKIGLQPEIDQTVREIIIDAIKTAKVYGLSPESLAWHIQSSDDYHKRRKQAQFILDIVLPVFEIYELQLQEQGKIDFEDMINHAVNAIGQIKSKNEETNMLKSYRMILVDEFQDISHQRLQLIRAFQKLDSDNRLFCVGDDWQAIYGFAGSSTRHMIHFERSSPALARVDLEQNYRNPSQILEFCTATINKCTEKIGKDLIPRFIEETETDFLVFKRLSGSNEWDFKLDQAETAFKLIEELIFSGVDPSEILVLSRFKKGYGDLYYACSEHQKIPVELIRDGKVNRPGVRFMTVHKSKGLEAEYVILLNTFKGVYGFPSEIKSKMDFNIINPDLPESLDEERRLFFVAGTRAKKKCIVFAWAHNESKFLVENDYFLAQFKIPEEPIFYGRIRKENPDSFVVEAYLSPSFKPTVWIGKKSTVIEPTEDDQELFSFKMNNWMFDKFKEQLESLTPTFS